MHLLSYRNIKQCRPLWQLYHGCCWPRVYYWDSCWWPLNTNYSVQTNWELGLLCWSELPTQVTFNESSILHILQIDIIEIDIYNATKFSLVLYSFGQFEIHCSYKQLFPPIYGCEHDSTVSLGDIKCNLLKMHFE